MTGNGEHPNISQLSMVIFLGVMTLSPGCSKRGCHARCRGPVDRKKLEKLRNTQRNGVRGSKKFFVSSKDHHHITIISPWNRDKITSVNEPSCSLWHGVLQALQSLLGLVTPLWIDVFFAPNESQVYRLIYIYIYYIYIYCIYIYIYYTAIYGCSLWRINYS